MGEVVVQIKKTNLAENIDAGTVNIRRDGYFPRAYVIDLALDSVPDHVWQDIFERQWRTSRHLWDRKLFIIGDTLRLVTSPEDIEEKLGWIKEIVTVTNKKVEDFNKQQEWTERASPQIQRLAIEHEEALGNIREALRKIFQS